MKKTILLSILAVLCLFLSATAQENSNITPLKIGDQVPEITIKNIINYKSADGKPATTAKISDFKGKLLILDFWATWCAPCVSMIPKMDSLQKRYAGKIQFISVTTQPASLVSSFMAKLEKMNRQHYDFPEMTGDTLLSSMFAHRTLPHYVWIDQQGIVKANTEFTDVNGKTIEQFLNQEKAGVKQILFTPAIPYDNEVPLYAKGNGGNGEDFLYHSILTSYKPGLSLQRIIRPGADGSMRILCKNLNILQLFATAYMDKGPDYLFMPDSIKLNVKDSLQLMSNAIGMDYEQWLGSGHGFCYELKVPPALKKQAFEIMRGDISRFFPDYSAGMTMKQEPCLELRSIGRHDKLKTDGGNSEVQADEFGCAITNNPISYWIGAINRRQLSKKMIVNKTGITDKVDISITGNLNDLTAVNKQLSEYGLRLEPAMQEVPVLVISDRKSDHPN
jgi:thiol-disulfide isomerase/thioredoxin